MEKSKIQEVFSSKTVLFIIILLLLRGLFYIPYGVYYANETVKGINYISLLGFFNFVMAAEKIVPAFALTAVYASCRREFKEKQYQACLFILRVIMITVSVIWVVMSVIGTNFLNMITQSVNEFLIFILFPMLLFNTLKFISLSVLCGYAKKFIYGKWIKLLLISSMGMFVCDVLFLAALTGKMVIMHFLPYVISTIIDIFIFITAWKYNKIKGDVKDE